MIDPVSGRLRRVLEGHSRPVLALLYLPDGQTIVSAGLDETLRVWDGSGAPVRTLHNHTAGVHGLALRPGAANAESAVIASAGADRTVRLWQPASGRLIRFVRLPCSVQAVVWNRDGSRLIAAGSDGHVRLIDPDTVAVARDLPAITGWVHSVAVTPNGNDVLVGGQAGQLSRQPLN
jgi:WD40 repeat protein